MNSIMTREQVAMELEIVERVNKSTSYELDRATAEKFAIDNIKKYCPSYTFIWDSAKRRFGECNWKKKTIKVSWELARLNSMSQFKDTVLHEIAHALTEPHGHDNVWKSKARELGCNPERCYSNEINKPKGKYTYACKHCGIVRYYHKKLNRLHGCIKCCKKYNNNKFSYDYVMVLNGPTHNFRVLKGGNNQSGNRINAKI